MAAEEFEFRQQRDKRARPRPLARDDSVPASNRDHRLKPQLLPRRVKAYRVKKRDRKGA